VPPLSSTKDRQTAVAVAALCDARLAIDRLVANNATVGQSHGKNMKA